MAYRPKIEVLMILKNGFFITIEGIDGSGKTTFANNLYQYLLKNNFSVMQTKEPSQTAIGEQIRAFLQKRVKVTQKAQYLLFAADRAEHFHEIIIPAINGKYIIISDRCGDSSVAYQGYGLGLDIEMIKQINKWVMNNIQPDITFYLKLDPKIALERVNKRNEIISEFENLTLMEKISKGFDEIFKDRQNVITLDALQSPENILTQAIKHIESKLIYDTTYDQNSATI
jgi:dTMP kinase